MRRAAKILAAVIFFAGMSGVSVSNAAFFSFPRMLGEQVRRISFDNPVLAPMGHIRFCVQNPGDCQATSLDFRRRRIALSVARWDELNQVNRDVNRDIIPDPVLGPETEQWKISPASGNCHDYAVTKRHDLLARGWPSQDLLLAEVVVPSGEHHLILVVRTKDADLVLDNLNANIRTAAMTRYQYEWVRIESPYNPKFWVNVTVPSPIHTSPTRISPIQTSMIANGTDAN
jgi:predicted transglutaminase-like cysteine proteinase